MTGAVLTALFFGITPVCAGRAIRLIGVLHANLFRLLVALGVLGAWTFLFGRGLNGPVQWFSAAGAIGFGIGGMAMFQALPRLGAPLASLIVESGAALFAGFLSWCWLADSLTGTEIAFAFIVLLGVCAGLLPYVQPQEMRAKALQGIAWALLAALGQGISITISRKAILGMIASGVPPHLPTAAFQRLLGGACVAFLALVLMKQRNGTDSGEPTNEGDEAGETVRVTDRPWLWVGLNALFGPILGVTCLIWALKTMQPGLVQTVAATAPLISVPFARWLEGHRPPGFYYLGGVIAIAGLAGIHLYR